ncbi:hypothetical protein [Halorientalis marina]|jgi:small-conductance mechanosensitive channel|uniref:hypothetical protein n=1 Tax=Halorientalis marina TaxID=2931976 RepID=UPI001FF0FC61|nr:hypothetical protein [Halorientalis marina]
MCLAALIDGDTGRPLRELVREEIVDATATGLLAVTLVVAVLGAQGAATGTLVASGAAAFALGFGAQLLLLVVGATLLRRRNGTGPEPGPA